MRAASSRPTSAKAAGGQRFEQIPGAGSVEIWGGVYREIQIRIDRDALYRSYDVEMRRYAGPR